MQCIVTYTTDVLILTFFLYVLHIYRSTSCCNSWMVVEVRITYITPFANPSRLKCKGVRSGYCMSMEYVLHIQFICRETVCQDGHISCREMKWCIIFLTGHGSNTMILKMWHQVFLHYHRGGRKGAVNMERIRLAGRTAV